MAEKGVEEQVLAMERLQKHSDFSLCLNVTTVSDILLD